MSVAFPSCRFCGGANFPLVRDPALGATRIRRNGVRDTRQTYHHPRCLVEEADIDEMPVPMDGPALERARERRREFFKASR